jgi:hypothetical protein
MISMLRQNHYVLPQIRIILDGLRQTGSSDALRAAIAQRQSSLTERTSAMLGASSRLHHYLTTEPDPGDFSEPSREWSRAGVVQLLISAMMVEGQPSR